MDSLLQDLKLGLRTLLKNRAFSIVAILTLALGIGANTAIFSVVNSVLLHALPFPDAGSLMFLRETVGVSGFGSVSYPNYLDWRLQSHVFAEMAAYSSSDLNLTATGTAERVFGEVVTDSYFPLLRLTPVLGRTFSSEENENPTAAPVAVIGNGLWKREFEGRDNVLGRTIKVNGATFTIIGVLPKNFAGVTGRAELWIPLGMRDLLWPEGAQFHFNQQRDIHWHRVLGRLKPGVRLEQARTEMNAIGARLAQAYPQANKERGVQVISASEAYLGKLRSPLFLLLGAVGCVLLIACTNVANLFLIRATARENEMAVRAALGAGRRRLMQQWMVEGTLVAMIGGGLGLLIVGWGVGVLEKMLPFPLPAFSAVTMGRGVFAFTIGISLITGALLGLVPALRASGKDLVASLKEGSKSSGGRRGLRTGALLVTAEIALAVVVMIAAGLLLRSFERLRHVDTGFRPDHLLLVRIDIPATKYTGEGRLRVGPQIAEGVAALPQVESAALTILDPFVWGGINRGITVEGHTPLTASEQDDVYVQEIGPNFFQTMRIPMRGGRDFSKRDNSSAPHVAIVSHAFAQRYWPGQDPVGKRLKYGPANSTYGWMEVVGEVGDVRFTSLRDDPYASSVIYAPIMQSEVVIDMSIVARTKTEPASVAGSVRELIQRLDPEIPVYSVATMDERIEAEAAATRSFATLLAMFALLAAGLAVVGIYATMAAQVARRTREIGIRMAVGAEPGAVLRMVLGQGARLALLGVGSGLAGGFWATRLLTAQLFGVSASDPLTFAAAAALLCGVAIAACWIPARRAMRVDPIVALRYE